MKKPEVIDIGFEIDDSKLRDIDIPEESIDLASLENNLDIPYLEREGSSDWDLSPRMLLDNFEAEVTHARRVQRVDLAYPILIYFYKNQWIIIDGVHRYIRAIKEGRTKILIKRLALDHLLRAKI